MVSGPGSGVSIDPYQGHIDSMAIDELYEKRIERSRLLMQSIVDFWTKLQADYGETNIKG